MAQGGAIPARAIGSVRLLLGALWSILPGLVIAASPEPGAAQDLRATLACSRVDSLGSPVVGAQVIVDGTLLHASTDAAGHFRLTDVPVGSLYLVVKRIGFRAATVPVRLGPAGASQLMVTLSAVPELLAPVEVTEPREVYDARLYGFESRAAKRKNGHFITRDRIEHLSSKRLSDLLRQVPAVRLAMVRGQGMMAYIRGARCPALVYIDGSPASAGPFDLDLVDVWTIEGIEVYGGFGAPAEFSSARADRCGVIAIWSRPFRPQARPAEPPPQTSLITAQVELDMVFEADAVDSVAIPVPGSIRTTYPDSLFRAQISGSAAVRFIVDTTGLVEMSTLEVSATHDLFAQAARDALREARFTPAVLQGRRVRQVVAIPFRFTPPRLSGEPRLPPK